MVGGRIAKRYAKALLDLCTAPGVQSALTNDLERFCKLFSTHEELRAVLLNPSVELEKRDSVLTKVLDKMRVHSLSRNVLRLLLRNQRIAHVEAVREALVRGLDARTGRVRADVVTAAHLDPVSRVKLQKALEALFGKQVIMEPRVDASLLGGAVTRVGHVVLDGSLRAHLERLRAHITAGTSI